jgi:phosphoribosylanthranilate isomerase
VLNGIFPIFLTHQDFFHIFIEFKSSIQYPPITRSATIKLPLHDLSFYPMIIKVCGITRVEDLNFADQKGADALGCIFGVPESPRSNDLNQLLELLRTPTKAQKALLTRNASPEQWDQLHLSFSQDLGPRPEIFHLCGRESVDLWKSICDRSPDSKIWQTVGIPLDAPEDESWKKRIDECWNRDECQRIVLDSSKGGKAGGTGQAFPFEMVLEHLGQDSQHFMLAGGLHPENVGEALEKGTWLGVDVSSGVESSPGIKDHQKIEDFISAIRD